MNNTPHLTIQALRVRGLDHQLARPVETASGVLCSAPLVLIDLVTDEGITGSSYIRCYTPLALQPLVQLVANCGELLSGQAAAPATIEQKLQQHFRLLGTQGLLGMALAGIDMALWDACAKACGLPLVILLGGELKPIPAYGSLRRMSPEGAAWEAEELLALGFTAFKVKLGRDDLAADLRLAAQGPYKIGLNEVAIGITVPRFGIEVARQRLTPAYFSRTVMTGEMFAPPEAVTAGFFDRIVPAASLDATADQAAEALSKINLPAHAATKLRARGPTIRAMRAAIDTDITLEDAEERVASRTAHP